jgi:hypothetical protein
MKKTIFQILTSLFMGFMIAFIFDSIFLNLSTRPLLDQVLLLFFSTASFGYLSFSLLEDPQGVSNWFRSVKNIQFRFPGFKSFLKEYGVGILLALFFLAIYTFLGLKLNIAGMDTVDNYLDADNTSWMQRIASPDGYKLEMRGPHPFAYFVFRPLGWVFNLFTNDFAVSAILINTLAGALCVFFAWAFIKDQTHSRTYSTLIASLLGLSTAHLLFGSVIETYIFSALALIVFFWLLQHIPPSFGMLVTAGVVTFGITLTNLIQNFIGFFVFRPKFKDIIRFAGFTLSFGILLSLIHAAWYPTSKLFFLPSDAQAEREFAVSLLNEPGWRAMGRIVLLIRTILLYTVIAPKPYIFTSEVGGTFPRFNFFKIVPGTYSYSSYDGLGNVLVIIWALLLLGSGLFFLYDIFRTRKVDVRLAFILCLLLNFILHLNYGYEPFLYSPDWAYALIFFVALSLAPLARNRIFQGGLFIFLLALIYNQLHFFSSIFDAVAKFLG